MNKKIISLCLITSLLSYQPMYIYLNRPKEEWTKKPSTDQVYPKIIDGKGTLYLKKTNKKENLTEKLMTTKEKKKQQLEMLENSVILQKAPKPKLGKGETPTQFGMMLSRLSGKIIYGEKRNV